MAEILDLTNDTDSEEESSSSSKAPEPEPALNDASRTQLKIAIATVSEQRLREVISQLVDTTPAAARVLLQDLVVFETRTRKPAPRWETCVNCDEEYDAVEPSEDDECNYHYGL